MDRCRLFRLMYPTGVFNGYVKGGYPPTTLAIELADGTMVVRENYVVTYATQIKTEYPTAKKILSAGTLSSTVSALYGAFSNMIDLEYADLTSWNTSAVTNMYVMFDGCKKLANIDVSNWDTSSLKNMMNMFRQCESLTYIDVSRWNTSAVTTMYGTFNSCKKLANIDVSGWNTSSVTTMGGMFYDCQSLISIDVSGWNTSSVTDIGYIFYGCSSLTSITNWKPNTINVTSSANSSPLDFSSVLTLLNACSDTPASGATMTFKSGLYANFSTTEKAQIDAVRNDKVSKGWTIVNMS